MQSSADTLQHSLAVPQKYLLRELDSPLPGADPREMKAGVQATTYRNVHSSFIYKSQNLKTAQMSINSRIHKATAVSPHNRILLSNKKESTINTHRMERSRNNYAECKKRGKKEYTVHGSIYINL